MLAARELGITRWFVRFALLFACAATAAAAAQPPAYDPREAFAPFALDPATGPGRSASGVPGPAYWQNRADYRIDATLNPATHSIRGGVTITYANNSPDQLDVLWLQLEQNRYLPGSRGNLSGGRVPMGITQGMVLDSATVDGAPVKPLISDTRAQLRLSRPLAAHGKAVIRIAYHYEVPKEPWGGRTGWMDSPNGQIYSVAQWYPRMAVYDDLRGWDPLPYLAQEFYLEYGDFDYSVTLPANYVVAGSGELVNENVLPQAQRARLGAARQSDKTVMIRAAGEQIGLPSSSRTWHFAMKNSRDVAFGASPAFNWDAARIRLPGGRSALAMSVYPPEAKAWNRSTEYLKDSGRAILGQMVSVSRGRSRSMSPARPRAWNIPRIAFDDIESPPKELFCDHRARDRP